MGLVGGGITFGVAIGAPLGGIIGRSNPLLPLQVGAAILFLTALFAAWVLPRHSAKGGHAGLPEIFRTVMGNKALLVPLSFAFADRFAVGFYVTTFPLYASRILGLDSAQIGMSLSLFLIPFALLSFPFGLVSERLSRVGMVCAGSLVFGLLTASLGWWPAGGLSALMLMVGVSAAVMYVPSLLLTAELSGESTKATALGGFNAAGSLGFILGPLTGGWISQTVARDGDWLAGYRTAFGFAGAAEILCVALALLALSAVWERTGRP